MLIKRTLLIFHVLCFCIYSFAQSFQFNENCRASYQSIISLKLKEGRKGLETEQKVNPDNLIAVYLENYIDFLSIFTSDARGDYERLRKNKELRLAVLSSGEQRSPYYLFVQAEVNLQWAALDIKFGEYMNAIFEIRKAYKMLEENQRMFPDFKPNRKSLGVLYALVGSVPDKYRWAVNLLGMNGEVATGMRYLLELVETETPDEFIFYDETVFYYSLLLFHLQDKHSDAWYLVKKTGFPERDNLLQVYICAHIGIYSKQTKDAIAILDSYSSINGYTSFPFLYYLKGLGALNSVNQNADYYFKQFISEYKGEHHVKSAYQKIAWLYLLKGDTLNYFHFMSKVKNLGAAMLDVDKQALKEANSGTIPNVDLLLARLWFDGGFYEQASAQMGKIDEVKNTDQVMRTEFYYRKARIYDEWHKPDSALVYYKQAIESGKELQRYFAANSALESGKIYEAAGDREKAKYFYELCMRFENHEYKNGLDQKAKAALQRMQYIK